MPTHLQARTMGPYTPDSMDPEAPQSGRSQRTLFSLLLTATVVLVAGLAPSSASSQGKKFVMTFDEEDADVVTGVVQKPEVGYIITRQEQEDLETLQLKESFIPRIVKSVEQEPF